jgi:hypothetical protein
VTPCSLVTERWTFWETDRNSKFLYNISIQLSCYTASRATRQLFSYLLPTEPELLLRHIFSYVCLSAHSTLGNFVMRNVLHFWLKSDKCSDHVTWRGNCLPVSIYSVAGKICRCEGCWRKSDVERKKHTFNSHIFFFSSSTFFSWIQGKQFC